VRGVEPLPIAEDPALDARLRQAVLAAIVVRDLDLVAADRGVEVAETGRLIPWRLVAALCRSRDPDQPATRAALGGWLAAVHAVAARTPDDLLARARPIGLPRGHLLHPGPTWVRRAVLGDSLDIGLGLLGLQGDDDVVDPLLPGVAEVLGHDTAAWWRRARGYLEEMGAIAAQRYARDPAEPLRPMGDCDVVTLLGSQVFRAALVGARGSRPAAVPMRTRGWLDPGRTDPAFAVAAAALTEPAERGFERPLIFTVDEVVIARDGGRPVQQSLREPAAPDPRPLQTLG
jgi:hypothetical protein